MISPSPLTKLAKAQADQLLPSLEQMEKRRDDIASLIKNFHRTGGRKIEAGSEPPRNKTHWDYLLEEMQWMANDFKRERKYHTDVARRLSRSVVAYHARLKTKENRQIKQEIAERKRLAAAVSREIKKFWSDIGSVVRLKFEISMEKQKKQALDRHLEFLVEQTQRYSSLVARGLMKMKKMKTQKMVMLVLALVLKLMMWE